jgi:thiol-disulfide isomerase/thioredoxin
MAISVVLFAGTALQGYPKRERLYEVMRRVIPIMREKRIDNTDSNVIVVDNLAMYNKVVLAGQKPVVLRVFTQKNPHYKKTKEIFQKVSDAYQGKVVFAAMDLPEEQQSNPEIFKILSSIMLMTGVKKVELPAFLFYRMGLPHMPAPIVHGVHTYENLVAIIDKKFPPIAHNDKK